ncbi:MAG: DNRLRE domain-containing protein [Methanothrix sp.]
MRYYAMKAMIALASIALLTGCAGAVKISPALQMDTYTDAENKNQSFGEEATLWVASQSEDPVKIAYLSFAGMTSLPQQVKSASLKMYVKEIEHPGRVSLYLYDNAAMDTITWSDQPEYDTEALESLDIQETGWQTWDATNFMKKAAEECSEGCPFSVVLVAEGDASISFASLEGSAEEKAVLEYEAS